MKYIDVRVRLPLPRMGTFIDELPTWAAAVGFDRLEDSLPPAEKQRGGWTRTRGANGEYIPAKGSTGEALHRYLKNKAPLRLREMKEALCRHGDHQPQGVASALSRLVHFKVVKRNKDGTYEVIK